MEYISKKLILLIVMITLAGLFPNSCPNQTANSTSNSGNAEYIGLISADAMSAVIAPRDANSGNIKGAAKVLLSCRVADLVRLLKEYTVSRLCCGYILFENLPASGFPSLVSLHCMLTV